MKSKKVFTPVQQSWVFRVPANATGERFIHQLKTYMNDDSYSVKRRYTGPRHNKNAAFTRKEDAISVRLYVNAKGDNGKRTTFSPDSLGSIRDLAIENMSLKRRLENLETGLKAIGRSVNKL